MRGASLVGANLCKAVLRHANLSGANVENANFDECEIFGAGLWSLQGQPASTRGMRVSVTAEPRRASRKPAPDNAAKPEPCGPMLEVDHLDAAQFLFVMLDNPRIGPAFDALNSRIVLILGRFGGGNLARLKAMQDTLVATGDFVPIVFDFERPALGAFAHRAPIRQYGIAVRLPDEAKASGVTIELPGR